MIYSHQLYQEELVSLTNKNINWKKLKGKSILITGASGMIGTFLIDVIMKRNETFQDEIKIYAVSRSMEKLKFRFKQYSGNGYLEMVEQDVSKKFCLDEYNLDYIIHAASNTHPREYANDPIGTITTNVFGSYYLFEYVKTHKNCRIVLLSSVEIYGENRGDTIYFDENYCGYINSNTLRAGYPESKRVSESLLQAYIAQYRIDGVLVRLSRVYGPTLEMDDSKAISQFIDKAVERKNIILKSNGGQLYSYVYISDAAQAILRCMLDGECGEAYNVADEKSDISLKDLAYFLADIVDTEVVFELPDEKEKKGYSTATKALLNSEKLKNIGWKAQYSIQEGLVKTVSILMDEKYQDRCIYNMDEI